MKRGYKKLFIFQLFSLIILLINFFILKFNNLYHFVTLLMTLLLLFKFIIGFEKDNHRYTKNVLIEIIITLLIFFLIYYIFGFFIGFIKTNNYYNFNGIINYILPIILIIIFKELLRYEMLVKSEGCKFLIISTCFLLIVFDILSSFHYINLNTKYELFLFLSLYLIPTISNNILCSYLSVMSGFKPSILYQFVMQLYFYLLPIVPDINDYLKSIINLLLPLIICRRIYILFEKEKDKVLSRDKNKYSYFLLFFTTLLIIILVYFVSGYFKYQAIAIASGSMNPAINKGDVVIIKKLNKKSRLKKKDIIAYKYNNITIVHRIVNIVSVKGENIYYTKGDANNNDDRYTIKENMIDGQVCFNIKYLGWPVVWLSSFNKGEK